MRNFFLHLRKKEGRMSISKRQEQILELLNEHGFLTVAKLSELTYTCPSSVRRDLAILKNLSLLKRAHGGASALGDAGHAVPLNSRMSKNLAEKRQIARLAAEFLSDGQTVMLDGSSTAGFLVPYIAKHKEMTLFTNNMLTAVSAVNYGIRTHCIGGCSVEGSAVVSGPQAYRAVEDIYPDVLFFSSQSLDRHGCITDAIAEENYLRILMLERARLRVFLCDSEKFGKTSTYKLTQLDEVDYAVFDKRYEGLKTSAKIL
jgi:DeoR family fructose operon transcriptional repressor